ETLLRRVGIAHLLVENGPCPVEQPEHELPLVRQLRLSFQALDQLGVAPRFFSDALERMQRAQVVVTVLEDATVGVPGLDRIAERVFPQVSYLREIGDLPLDTWCFVDCPFIELDELAVLSGLSVKTHERLERRGVAGDQRQGPSVVNGRVSGPLQPQLVDL